MDDAALVRRSETAAIWTPKSMALRTGSARRRDAFAQRLPLEQLRHGVDGAPRRSPKS